MKGIIVILIIMVPMALFAEDVSFKMGGFIPDGKSDIWEANKSETDFQVSDLAGAYVAVEADIFLGKYVNFACELGYYKKDTIAEDADYVFPDGSPIEHVIYLRQVPLEGSIKILPFGRNRKIILYVGGGIGLYFWDYQEYGDFVINRHDEPEIITGYFQSTGQNFGTHVMFGLMFPVGWHYSLNGEIKYAKVHGNLGRDFDPSFDPIDLSGLYITFGVSFWF